MKHPKSVVLIPDTEIFRSKTMTINRAISIFDVVPTFDLTRFVAMGLFN